MRKAYFRFAGHKGYVCNDPSFTADQKQDSKRSGTGHFTYKFRKVLIAHAQSLAIQAHSKLLNYSKRNLIIVDEVLLTKASKVCFWFSKS